MEIIVDEFNKYFVNIGPELAATIESSNTEMLNDSLPSNLNSLFLTATNEKEIIDIVNKFKSKRSIDCNDLDIIII